MNSWQIDPSYLDRVIKRGERLLAQDDLSKTELAYIRQDIANLKQFQQGDFIDHNKYRRIHASLAELGKRLNRQMQRDYKLFPRELVELIYLLFNYEPFGKDYDENGTVLAMADQMRLTLKNYETNAPSALPTFHYLTTSSRHSCIQLACLEDTDCYTYFSYLAQRPFIIVDPSKSATAFNHEVEHGIEYHQNISNNLYYSELGAILMEFLYLDILQQEQGYVNMGDYGCRLNFINEAVPYLSGYFMLMDVCAETGFNASLADLKIMGEEYLDCPKEEIGCLLQDLLGGDLRGEMMYLFSTLKAIEIYEEIKKNPQDAFKRVKPLVMNPDFTFTIGAKPLPMYENFVENLLLKSR